MRRTTGKVVAVRHLHGNRNEPALDEDLTAIFEHNGIEVALASLERCCGMPKLTLGDLEAIEKLKNVNIPALARKVDEGYDIVTPIPSCTLMFKQELPLLFPDDEQVEKVRAAMFDPFEYLWLRHKEGCLRQDFKQRIAAWLPCGLPPASAEHGIENQGCAAAGSGHTGGCDRALLGA